MIKEKITLQNETGLHARPAGELAKLASTFKCNINLNVNSFKMVRISNQRLLYTYQFQDY